MSTFLMVWATAATGAAILATIGVYRRGFWLAEMDYRLDEMETLRTQLERESAKRDAADGRAAALVEQNTQLAAEVERAAHLPADRADWPQHLPGAVPDVTLTPDAVGEKPTTDSTDDADEDQEWAWPR